MSSTRPNLSRQEELIYAFQMADWKIERAKHHISHVEEIIRWVVDPANYVIVPERDPQSGNYGCHIGPKGGRLPHHLPCVIGDAIHNLAACLDFLWNGLARCAVPGTDKRAQFPRDEERQHLANTIRKSPVHQTFPQTESLILDRIRSYKNGNFSIWALIKMDNIDKHRLLVSTFAVTKFNRFIATSEDGGVIDLTGATIRHKGDTFRLGFTSPFKLNDDVSVTAEILFDEPSLPIEQPVLEVLVNFVNEASQTVQAFRETFL